MPANTLRGPALALLIGAAIAASPAHAADHLRVAKPAAIGFGFSMLDVGISAGIFKKHDLDVESMVLEGAAKQHQAMMARFIAGWFETVAYVKAHKDDTLRITREVTRLPPDEASRVYDVIAPTLADNGHFDPKAVDSVKQSMLDLGQVDKLPDNKDLYTEAYLP